MIYVSDAAEMNLLDTDEKLNLFEFIKTPRYRVGDTSLTYRQAHLLSKDGVLDAQEDEGKWRKFSFNELVYVLIVKELKQMGFSNKQLVSLHEVFFRDEKMVGKKMTATDKPTGYAPKVIGYALIGVPLILKYTHDGQVDFFDPPHFTLFGCKGKAFVCISLNEIINDLSKKIGVEIELKTNAMFEMHINQILAEDEITKKERAVLEAMRSGEFERLEVVFDNGEVSVMRGTKRERGDLSPKEILDAIRSHAYQKLTVYVEDGKVVTCVREPTRKL